MSTVTLRPNGTKTNGSSSATGAASRHAALSDDSGASYVTFSGNNELVLEMENWAQPSGSVIRRGTARLFVQQLTSTPISHSGVVITDPGGDVTDWIAGFVGTGSFMIEDSLALPQTSTDFEFLIRPIQAAYARYLEVYFDVIYAVKPTLTVDTPTGTITENRPTITWTPTFDADAHPYKFKRVKIFTDAQYGAGGFDPDTSTPFTESGVVFGTTGSWTPDVVFPDDTYRAYVQIASVIEAGVSSHNSDWEYAEFTVDSLVPGDPTLTLTPQPNQARIKIELDDTTGDVATNAFFLERSLDQEAWETVRHTADRIEFSGSAVTVYDLEAPNGTVVYYRVRAVNDTEDTFSNWTTDNSVWSSDQAWIKHPFDPSLQLAVKFKSAPGYSRERRAQVHQGINAPHAYVVEDTPGPKRGTLELWLLDANDRPALDALLYSRQSLLIDSPGDWDCRWVRLLDSTDRTKALDQSWSEITAEVMQWIEMPRPEGNLTTEPPEGDDGDEDLLLT